jgi:hypothetical protein
MTTSLAEKRRKLFLKEKEKHEDVNALIRNNIEKDVDVYFNDNGDILQIGHGKRRKNKKELKITMKREQVNILEGKNWNLYKIEKDPIEDNVFSIQLRPTENLFVKSEEEFLQKIETGNKRDSEIIITIKEYYVRIEMSKKAKNIFKGKENVSIKGSKVLKFYFTAENDPHYMIHGINVFLKDLIKEEAVEVKTPLDVTHCDVYTYKLFDKYVRT